MRKKILGVNVDFGLTMDDVVNRIDEVIQQRKGSHLVATTNPYFIMAAQEDSEFKEIVNNSLLSIPDGVGVLYANYYLNKVKNIRRNLLFPLRAFFIGLKSGMDGFIQRKEFGVQLTGVDLTYRLFKLAEQKNYTMLFLGGRPRNKKGERQDHVNYDMATEAANVVRKLHPNVRIICSSSAYSREPNDDRNTVNYIHDCMQEHNIKRIDIALVAYNPVGQEKWINRNAKSIPVTTSVGIGRTFDYITEHMRQPARIYEKMHIAWLYALIVQLWRFKRVVMSFPIFPLKVYKDSLKNPD